MKLNSNYSTLKDLKEVNATREGYLALLVPQKEHTEVKGDMQANKSQHHHLDLINDWSKWMRHVEIKKIETDIEEVKRDLKPMYEWLKGLYEVEA